MRKVPFVINEIYHVYNRGVEKRDIFLDIQDYNRFLFCLDNFNKNKLVTNSKINFNKQANRGETSIKETGELVEIINWCLMPNHYHLCLREIVPGGISKFLQKVMTGYTMYFNKKYKRTGVLFQGVVKSQHIANDAYFQYLQYYIDVNPLDLIESKWKENGVRDIDEAVKFLGNYKWSKRKDYEEYRKMINSFDPVMIQEVGQDF